MKLYLKSILLLLFFSNCSAQKDSITTLNYEAHTRGNSLIITVNSKNLIHSNFEGEKIVNISDKQWTEIQTLIKKIDLKSINDLEAPSTKSHTDAALIASIKISIDDKIYDSNTFDHGNPPQELKELIDLLFSIAKAKQ